MSAPIRTVALAAPVIAAVVLTRGMLAPGAAHAQNPPVVLYGKGLNPGQTVSAWIGGKLCASTMANGAGEWSMQISDTNPCGPTGGAPISFQVDGKDVSSTPSASFVIGGVPSDIANGYRFGPAQAATPTAMATPTASANVTATSTPAGTSPAVTATATATAAPTVVPLPPKTGGAGLLDASADRGVIWLLVTAVLVAGAGIAARTTCSRRSS